MNATNHATLKTSEAATILNVNPNTLRNWEKKYGFPPSDRSPSNQRLFRAPDINILRRLLKQGYTTNSAIAQAKNISEQGKVELTTALNKSDGAQAVDVLERTVEARSLEDAVSRTLLPAVESIGQARGFDSCAWLYAARLSCDWMANAKRASTNERRGNVLIIDASENLSQGAVANSALELFIRHQDFYTLALPVRYRKGIDLIVNKLRPVAVIMAGAASGPKDIGAWQHDLTTARYPINNSFRVLSPIEGTAILPESPLEASRQVAQSALQNSSL